LSAAQILALPPPPFPPAFFSPIVDGWLMPEDFAEAYANGRQMNVPFMAGWTSVYYPAMKITLAEYRRWAQARFGALADEYLALYPASSDAEASAMAEQGARDSYRSSLLLWAAERRQRANAPTFIYYYNHGLPGATNEKFGASAGDEIPYVTNSLAKLNRAFTARDHEIAAMMSSYWANFAKGGNPNGAGLAHWPAFDTASRNLMQLGDDTGVIAASSAERFDFYKRYFATRPQCTFAAACSINVQ
jgi:para-nitrobenzyl esterase